MLNKTNTHCSSSYLQYGDKNDLLTSRIFSTEVGVRPAEPVRKICDDVDISRHTNSYLLSLSHPVLTIHPVLSECSCYTSASHKHF